MVCVTSEWKRKNSSSRSMEFNPIASLNWVPNISISSSSFPPAAAAAFGPSISFDQSLFFLVSPAGMFFFYFSIECDVTFFKSKGGFFKSHIIFWRVCSVGCEWRNSIRVKGGQQPYGADIVQQFGRTESWDRLPHISTFHPNKYWVKKKNVRLY